MATQRNGGASLTIWAVGFPIILFLICLGFLHACTPADEMTSKPFDAFSIVKHLKPAPQEEL